MAKTKKNEPKITIAYSPTGECYPILQDVPESAVDAWIEGILGTTELIVRPTVLSGIMMVCRKHDDDEHFNWVASYTYLHNRDEVIGGDVFFCRVDFHRQPDGKVKILGLRDYDIKRLNWVAEKIFKHHKRLEIQM